MFFFARSYPGHRRLNLGRAQDDGEISTLLLPRFHDAFEHRQVFLELPFHLLFEDILAKLDHVDDVCLCGQFDLGIAFGNFECKGRNGLQGTGDGFESIPAGRFVFDHFKCCLDSLSHEIAHTLET